MMMMLPNAPLPQLICLFPQTVSGLVDSLTQFINHGMKEAAANIAQFLARCAPPCQPPPSRPHVCPLKFPAPKPRKRRRRRRRRPKTSRPLPSSFKSQLSTKVDSNERLPIVNAANRRGKCFRRFNQDLMCVTIDMLAKTYSPGHVNKPPTLAIEYQPELHKSSEANSTSSEERNASDAQSALEEVSVK